MVDAVEEGTDDDLREELGDLLLQVYFHSQIATDEGRFTLDDVADDILSRLCLDGNVKRGNRDEAHCRERFCRLPSMRRVTCLRAVG